MVILNGLLKSLYKRRAARYAESEPEKLKIERSAPRQSVFFMPVVYAGAAIRKDAGTFLFVFFTPAPCGTGR